MEIVESQAERMDPASDLSDLAIHLSSEAVDAIPLGILRGTPDRRITYLNRAASALIGPNFGIGSRLEDLEFAPESEGVVEANLERRFDTQRASTYELTYVRRDLDTRVRVQVSGLPEYDSDGRLIGSIGFVTDKTMERANVAIHEAIGSASDPQGLLTRLDNAIREVIAFDSIIITLISSDRSGLRVFHERPDRTPDDVPGTRWWPMPPFVGADLDGLLVARPDSVEAMFSLPPYLELKETDPATRAWLQLGYRHMLRKPVMLDGKLVALVSLLRLDDRPFSDADVTRLDQLPIGETINIALALENKAELAFALKLIGHLGAPEHGIKEVGRVLVEELKAHFGWQHVSLFRVNYDDQTVSIVHQAADAGYALPEDYRQLSTQGLLGSVVLSGKPVRIGDVSRVSAYHEGFPKTKSEMCLPIPGDRVRWILNVESTLIGAFAAEEQGPVERLLDVAGLILDRTLAIEFNRTVLECVADAIFQTTAQGTVHYVNPACASLLDAAAESIEGRHISALISPAEGGGDLATFVGELLSPDRLLPCVVNLGLGNVGPIPVLLSGNALPPQVGGKVFVASDLRYRQQVQRMDALQDVYRQVASESRVPLALATAYLDELRSRSHADEEAMDLIDKADSQLRRADLPLERVVRLAAGNDGQELPLHPLDLRDLVLRLHADLPQTQRRLVQVGPDDADPIVVASRHELEFCLSSVLAFLLRMKAQRDVVDVRLRVAVDGPGVDFQLVDPLTSGPSETRLQAKGEQERDVALAEPVLQSLMRRMGGRFEISQRAGLCLSLVLRAAVEASS